MLTKWDNLLIRECKNEKPSIRKLRKIVAMRNAIHPIYVEDEVLAGLLLNIVINYDLTNGKMNHFILTTLSPSEQKYLHNLGTDQLRNQDLNTTHISNVMRACVMKIRLSKISKFPNFHQSLRWRLKNNP